MIRYAAILAAVASTASADICADVIDLQNGTRHSMTIANTTAACARGIAIGNVPFTHCAWPFAFRAAEATAIFENTLAAMEACPNLTRRNFEDQGVNHPDSYHLRIFDLAGGEVSVSLKDKGALQQTYIFLRAQAGR